MIIFQSQYRTDYCHLQNYDRNVIICLFLCQEKMQTFYSAKSPFHVFPYIFLSSGECVSAILT